MKPLNAPPAGPEDEIARLIAALSETEQRLEELTGGEVDTVSSGSGTPFLLRRAQLELRDREAGRQTAILDALPAHIALLDAGGEIISVNESWRRFAAANGLPGSAAGVGMNYLEICDRARGPHATEAREAAAGIRTVLAGAPSFSIEYPCHAPAERR
jgi:PAS domain-containing protein